MNSRRGAIVLSCLLVAVIAIVWVVCRTNNGEASVEHARRELRRGNAETALRIVQAELARNPNSPGAGRVAAMAHASLGEFEKAAAVFISLTDPRAACDALFAGSEHFFAQGEWSRSAALLRKTLELFSDDVASNRKLATILNSSGQRWDSLPHGRICIAQQQFSLKELLLWGNPEEPYVDEELLPAAARMTPHDPLVLAGLAAAAIQSGDTSKAIELLDRAITADDTLLEAHAVLGGLLVDRADLQRLISWKNSLPENACDHSEIWYVWGRWAQSTNQHEAAARCYWECAVRAPESRKANFQLGQVLTQLNRFKEAEQFLQRAAQLTELQQAMRPIYFEGPNSESMIRVARLMEDLGRGQEAMAWHYAITRFAPGEPTAKESLARMQALGADRLPNRADDTLNPAARIVLSALPLPNWELAGDAPAALTQLDGASWFFPDRAAAAGIHFQYFNSDDPQTEGKRMFETTGGGVAVADFDSNGWNDIYLTQGCRWPPDPMQREFADHCYFNTGRGTFRECSEASGLLDFSYSQGASAGDFDNDGFADLYVANIGQNRLFKNNGDGTFAVVAVEDGMIDASWTTSCVMADLDGDSLPDLYDANYLSGQDAFEIICGTDHPRTCSPATFTGAFQRVCRNQGDGTWRDITSEAGIGGLRGKGLGVVVARMTNSPRPELLVANDGIANFLFKNSNEQDGGQLHYQEIAIQSGLAFDRDGRAQACMGIAADDFNGDSRLDFLVTNFYEESNTLYVQKPGLLFADETREAGLRNPSLLMLGFGTQFLDTDLDGFPDLVVANGHVDDFSYDGKAYRMRPQCFRNAGDGRFQELIPDRADTYFSGEYLGRGLARIDWNRDGQEDFVVSHLDSPAALATNESGMCGKSLSIRLIGVLSSRDAIGTIVTLTSAGRKRTRQLTAGDGYQASNERILVFGLGNSDSTESVLVQWPSGTEQLLSNLSAGFEYRIVEGRDLAVRIPFEAADQN